MGETPPASVRSPKIIRQTFVKSRLGWYVHTTHGVSHAGEVPLFAFTLKRAERKAERLAARLRRTDEAWASAREWVR